MNFFEILLVLNFLFSLFSETSYAGATTRGRVTIKNEGTQSGNATTDGGPLLRK